jgi:hypothetical protein
LSKEKSAMFQNVPVHFAAVDLNLEKTWQGTGTWAGTGAWR